MSHKWWSRTKEISRPPSHYCSLFQKKIQKRTIDCSLWAWPPPTLLFAFEKFSIVGKSNFLGANSNFCRCASKYATKYCILMGIFVVSSCCRQNYCKKVESKNQLFVYPLTPPPTIVREQLLGQSQKKSIVRFGLDHPPTLFANIFCVTSIENASK